MIKKDDLIALFERMRDEHWRYEWGGAKEGCVDCSGAFIYAFKELDGYDFPYHSSNWMARSFIVGELLPASMALPGYAVFRWRKQSGDTPERWQDGRGDFYHVGLMGNNGKVLNAKGTRDGFVESSLSGWDYCAKLKRTSYTALPVDTLYRAQVTTLKDPLRVRSSPETGEIIGHVPSGRLVDVLSEDGEWANIRYNEVEGWASTKYLTPTENPVEPDYDHVEPEQKTTTLKNRDGQYVTLVGDWHVVYD